MPNFVACRIAAALLLFTAGFVIAQEATDKPKAKPKAAPNPAMAKLVDDPKLPRVLLIGDSISIGYTLPVRELLKDAANLHRIPTNGGPTSNGIKNIEAWLGDGKWDVIHFNWGLHDLKLIEGKQQVSPADYEANLRKLVARMKTVVGTNGQPVTLIWATTTPVPEGELNPPRKFHDVLDYNAIAAKVMADENERSDRKVITNDLYEFAKPQLAEIQNKNDVHFSAAGSRKLGEKVAKEIVGALNVRKKEGEKGRQGDGEKTSKVPYSRLHSVGFQPQRGAVMPAQGNALGLAGHYESEALKGRHFFREQPSPPLQGLAWNYDQNPGRRSRWSLALGWNRSAPLGLKARLAQSPKAKQPAANAVPLTKKADTAEATSVSIGLERLKHNHPGLVVDLGVGLWAWPVPCDADGDGDFDLIVSCPDKPYNGTYLFENPGDGKTSGHEKFLVFKSARRLSAGHFNVTPSYIDGRVVVTTPGNIHPDFLTVGLEKPTKLSLPADPIGKSPDWLTPHKPGVYKLRHNQWKYVDYDGDKVLDLVVALENWSAYGWDDAWDEKGQWQNGPLHGLLYLFKNTDSTEQPKYAEPKLIEARSAELGTRSEEVVSSSLPSRSALRAPSSALSTFGLPSPNFADFDGDGDLDLLCGEFLDGFTYFQNVGTRTEPSYAAGKRLMREGRPLTMDLEMIVPVAFDWDRDGDLDLIVGDEDGRVALVENYGPPVDGVPQFLAPKYFKQEADDVKFGALATACGFDWDGDGDTDLIAGNTAGYIAFIENLSGPGVEQPRWAAPEKLEADGDTIRIMAGPNGSIQGPAEAKWGYTTETVADWDHDGLPDLIVNSIWGKVVWYRNVGTRQSPELAAAQPIEVSWPDGKARKPEWTWWGPKGNELVSQWRTTPVAIDFTRDGLCDLVMLDQEGYLALFERSRVTSVERREPEKTEANATPLPSKASGERTKPERDQLAASSHSALSTQHSVLLPPRRAFIDESGKPLQLNAKRAGGSGRRKLCVVDWDGDGKLDVLLNGINANWLRQVEARDGSYVMKDMGPLDTRKIEGHDTSPTTVDWNNDGVPDLLVGAEDGRFYYLRNTRTGQGARAEGQGTDPQDRRVGQVAFRHDGPPKQEAQPNSKPRDGGPALEASLSHPTTGSATKAILSSELIYEDPPTPSCHASTIIETKEGLVAAWFGGTYEKHPDVGIWFSRHVDGKWTKPVEVANGVESAEKRYPCWNPILFQPTLEAGGKPAEKPLPLMLFYKVGPSPDTWWGMLIMSDDAGRSWSKPRRLPDGILGPIKNKPIQLPNGDILCGTSSEHAGWRVHFERSSDLGQTWKATEPVNDGKQIGAIQPSFLVHKDGRLQAVGRTQQKFVFEVSSTDGGQTWGPLTLTSLPNPNAGTDAVTLADGRHLIVYNHTPRGRSPLNVAVSTNGKDWEAALVLEKDPGEYSYPAVIQTSDGLVHITYTWKRLRVKHVVVDPKQFTPKQMVGGKWPD